MRSFYCHYSIQESNNNIYNCAYCHIEFSCFKNNNPHTVGAYFNKNITHRCFKDYTCTELPYKLDLANQEQDLWWSFGHRALLKHLWK